MGPLHWELGVLATGPPGTSLKMLLCHALWIFSHGNFSFLGDFVTLLRTPPSWVLGCLVILALDGGRVPSPSEDQSTLLPKPSTEQNSSDIGDSHCDAFLHVLPQRNPGLHFLDNFWCPSQNVTNWTLTFSGRWNFGLWYPGGKDSHWV